MGEEGRGSRPAPSGEQRVWAPRVWAGTGLQSRGAGGKGPVARGTSLEPRLRTAAFSLRDDGGVDALKSRPIFNCGPEGPESSESTLHDGLMRSCDLT